MAKSDSHNSVQKGVARKGDKELLAVLLDATIFRFTGFAPSRNLCNEFAERIYEQALSMNVNLDWDL